MAAGGPVGRLGANRQPSVAYSRHPSAAAGHAPELGNIRVTGGPVNATVGSETQLCRSGATPGRRRTLAWSRHPPFVAPARPAAKIVCVRPSCVRFVLGLLAAAALAGVAQAQRSRAELGIAVDWRGQMGAVEDSSDRRRGLSVRIQADIPWLRHASFRLEGSWVQVQYSRYDAIGAIPINETSYEVGGFVRGYRARTGLVRPYVLAGGVASYRASCEFDNPFGSSGFVSCGGGDDFLMGWGAGVGVKLVEWVGGWNWFAETRVLTNTTAAGGGNLLTISIGAGM
jgi:hypothetical protein